jgi:site-specific DNA recombinase
MNMSANVPVSIASRARSICGSRAEVDLSIPDQRLQTMAYCERQGWQVVADYVEPGAPPWTTSAPSFSV